MKLFASFSEAIREGAKLRPQAFNAYFQDGRSCAVGAAHEAITGEHDTSDSVARTEHSFDYLNYWSEDRRCVECAVRLGTHISAITHLNDTHKWSRERIADWLESEEEKLGYVTVVESRQSVKPELCFVSG